MIVLIHTTLHVIAELSLPAWQKEVRNITYEVIEAMKEAKKYETAVWDMTLCMKYFFLFLCKQTYFSKCDPFFQVWPIFPSVTHFPKCDPFLQVWPIFRSVIRFSICVGFFQLLLISSKCDPFFKYNQFVSSVIHFFRFRPLFQVWPIFKIWPNYTH